MADASRFDVPYKLLQREAGDAGTTVPLQLSAELPALRPACRQTMSMRCAGQEEHVCRAARGLRVLSPADGDARVAADIRKERLRSQYRTSSS